MIQCIRLRSTLRANSHNRGCQLLQPISMPQQACISICPAHPYPADSCPDNLCDTLSGQHERMVAFPHPSVSSCTTFRARRHLGPWDDDPTAHGPSKDPNSRDDACSCSPCAIFITDCSADIDSIRAPPVPVCLIISELHILSRQARTLTAEGIIQIQARYQGNAEYTG